MHDVNYKLEQQLLADVKQKLDDAFSRTYACDIPEYIVEEIVNGVKCDSEYYVTGTYNDVDIKFAIARVFFEHVDFLWDFDDKEED